MTAVDVDPRPLAGRLNPFSGASERSRRWAADVARRNHRPEPVRPLQTGITVNGLSEPGATVLVTLAGQATSVAADDRGRWTAEFDQIDVPQGTVEIPVCAVTTDASGRKAAAEGVVQVET